MQALVVEDDANVQQFLVAMLKRLDSNIHIFMTDSATEALKITREKKIDFFIVDIQLVDFKGTDLVKHIRMLPSYQFAPIVFETGIATEELYAYRELKCFYYLIKPYTEAEFCRVMEEVFAYLNYTNDTPDEATLKIEQKGFLFEYYLRDLYYIESFGKKLCLHVKRDGMLEEVMISNYSLKRVLELVDVRFVQVHKSFIVNRNQVEMVDWAGQRVKLRGMNGDIPIGLKFQDILK